CAGPEDVAEEPAEIREVAALVARRADAVDVVGHEQRDGAGREEQEGRRAPRRGDEEAGEACEEDDVHRGIGGGDRTLCGRARTVDDLVDDPDPLEERKRRRHDRRLVDRREPVVAAGSDEEREQAGREERIAAEVEPVGDRGHRRVDELVEDDVRDGEREVARGEQEPGQPIVGAVERDGPHDRERRADAHDVVDVVLGGAARDQEVRDAQREARGQEERAGAIPPKSLSELLHGPTFTVGNGKPSRYGATNPRIAAATSSGLSSCRKWPAPSISTGPSAFGSSWTKACAICTGSTPSSAPQITSAGLSKERSA